MNKDESALVVREREAVTRARELVIRDGDSYVVACDYQRGWAALEKEIVDTFRESKRKTDAAHKEVVAMEKRHLQDLQIARKILGPKIATYMEEQARSRREEERRLQLEADNEAEKERLDQALALDREGLKEEAGLLLSEPLDAPVIVAPKNIPDAKGISARQTWKAQCVSLKTLIKAVADGKVSELALQPNETFLNSQARALKGTMDFPGVRVWSERSITTRTGG